MTTILLCWYCCGWISAGIMSYEPGPLTRKDLAGAFIIAPVIIIIFPFILIDWNKPVWERKL